MLPRFLRIQSYAKLNLFLEVKSKRKDGFHPLVTLFEKIDLSDTIILRPRVDGAIKIICAHPGVPSDKRNLCFRSAELLKKACRVKEGVTIKIVKRIPVGAGLGGGSSNAAAALEGLNRLWKLNLSMPILRSLSKQIGSDVAFFTHRNSFALGVGRGDIIQELNSLKDIRLWHILVVPKIRVLTHRVYQKWDYFSRIKNKNVRLTKPKYDVRLLTSSLRRKAGVCAGEYLYNGLEPVTTYLYPEVRRVKEKLSQMGVKSILMSGSGPAVFGIVSSKKEALALSAQLQRERHSWRVFVTRTRYSLGNRRD